MDVILVILYVVVAGSVALALVLGARRMLARRRMPHGSWATRSGGDRRTRSIPVIFDRRRGLRREEDVSKAYLASLGK